MNKQRVNEYIPIAVEALQHSKCGIVTDGKIISAYRGQISVFGASVMNGSLLAAVSFFSDDGGAAVKREKLMEEIYVMVTSKNEGKKVSDIKKDSLYNYVAGQMEKGKEFECREDIMNAAIALKLAMNVFTLTNESKPAEKKAHVRKE